MSRIRGSQEFKYATAGESGFTVNSATDKLVTDLFSASGAGGLYVAKVVELYPSVAMNIKFNSTDNDAIPLLANTLRVFEDVIVTSIYAEDGAGGGTLKVYLQGN